MIYRISKAEQNEEYAYNFALSISTDKILETDHCIVILPFSSELAANQSRAELGLCRVIVNCCHSLDNFGCQFNVIHLKINLNFQR